VRVRLEPVSRRDAPSRRRLLRPRYERCCRRSRRRSPLRPAQHVGGRRDRHGHCYAEPSRVRLYLWVGARRQAPVPRGRWRTPNDPSSDAVPAGLGRSEARRAHRGRGPTCVRPEWPVAAVDRQALDEGRAVVGVPVAMFANGARAALGRAPLAWAPPRHRRPDRAPPGAGPPR